MREFACKLAESANAKRTNGSEKAGAAKTVAYFLRFVRDPDFDRRLLHMKGSKVPVHRRGYAGAPEIVNRIRQTKASNAL